MLFSNTENSYILLIPKLDNTFEEKKDLIFSRLSLNENIITVKEIDKKIIVNKLKQQIEINNIEENLIPEVFEIILKKNSKMELGKETKTLREILPEAEILKKITEKQALTLINYLFFYISLFIFFTTLIILQNNFVSKINSFLTRSRIFGVSDTEVIFKVSVGYLFFQFLGTLTALFIMYSIETEYKSLEIFTIKNLKALVIFFCIFSILCFTNLTICLKKSLKKVL
ncbi:MAG: hypothetical protein VX089_04565 [Pseudomonadota bacterium]|nr:hypothetical protein [Pseudomonadota bacterium]